MHPAASPTPAQSTLAARYPDCFPMTCRDSLRSVGTPIRSRNWSIHRTGISRGGVLRSRVGHSIGQNRPVRSVDDPHRIATAQCTRLDGSAKRANDRLSDGSAHCARTLTLPNANLRQRVDRVRLNVDDDSVTTTSLDDNGVEPLSRDLPDVVDGELLEEHDSVDRVDKVVAELRNEAPADLAG